MDEAVAQTAQTLDVEYCKVLELFPDGQALLLRAGVGWHDGLVGTGIVGAELDSQAGYTLVSSEPVIVEDLDTETRFHGPPLLHAHGVVSGISVIIAGQPRLFGVFGVHSAARRIFSQDDVNFLQAVANILAEAIARKHAEVTLQASERFARSTINALLAHLAILDEQGTILAVNKAWRDFGQANDARPETTAEGMNYLAVCDVAAAQGDAQAAAIGNGIRTVIRGEQAAFSYEYPCHSATEQRWFVCRVTRFPEDGPTRIVVMHHNITERKLSEAWRQQLLETTQDAVIAIDRSGHMRQFNPAAERMFGYTAAEVLGQRVNMLMPEPYVSEHDGYIERYERTREPHAIGQIRTVSAKRNNGEVFPMELSVAEVSADGDLHYGAFIRDISEKVKLQEKMVDRERLAAIGTTAATLAHEIGNPLNGMSMSVQMMERRLAKAGEDVDARFSSYVVNMKREITRLTNLLQEFRSLSRRQTFTFQPLNMSTVINELLAVETPHYTERRVQVEQHIPDTLPEMQADADKLRQVFLNLCKNAVEAMPDGGTLTLHAHAAEEYVHIEVSDTGNGIPDGVDIFEPFATTKAEGTGLGLPVVRQIITAHGGTLSYTSRPGQGTTFTVVLPLIPRPVPA